MSPCRSLRRRDGRVTEGPPIVRVEPCTSQYRRLIETPPNSIEPHTSRQSVVHFVDRVLVLPSGPDAGGGRGAARSQRPVQVSGTRTNDSFGGIDATIDAHRTGMIADRSLRHSPHPRRIETVGRGRRPAPIGPRIVLIGAHRGYYSGSPMTSPKCTEAHNSDRSEARNAVTAGTSRPGTEVPATAAGTMSGLPRPTIRG